MYGIVPKNQTLKKYIILKNEHWKLWLTLEKRESIIYIDGNGIS